MVDSKDSHWHRREDVACHFLEPLLLRAGQLGIERIKIELLRGLASLEYQRTRFERLLETLLGVSRLVDY